MRLLFLYIFFSLCFLCALVSDGTHSMMNALNFLLRLLLYCFVDEFLLCCCYKSRPFVNKSFAFFFLLIE
jgi:hypothetical protein